MKRGIVTLSKKLATTSKKVKVLQQKVRRQKHKLTSLRQIIFQLKEKNLINDDASEMLLDNFGKHTNLITNWAKKNLGLKKDKKHSPEVRQFALSLHFFSAKAYEYVRKEFNTILPHARTLSKWYAFLDSLMKL